jgi:hypothetical protein
MLIPMNADNWSRWVVTEPSVISFMVTVYQFLERKSMEAVGGVADPADK